MKVLFTSLLATALTSSSAFADERPRLGLVVGAPTGLSASWTLFPAFATQLHAGVTLGDRTPTVMLDGLLRFSNELSASGRVSAYVGLGLQWNGAPPAENERRWDALAIRTPFGMSIKTGPFAPLGLSAESDLFLEVAPGIGIVQENRAVISFALGARI